MKASILLVFCLFFPFCFSQEKPCAESMSIDITNGTNLSDTFLWDKVEYKKGEYYENKGKVWGCICKKKKCIRNCYVDKLMDKRNNMTISIFNGTTKIGIENLEDYHFLYGYTCSSNGSYLLVVENKELPFFYLQQDTSLLNSEINISYTMEQYCLTNGTVGALCEKPDEEDGNDKIHQTLLLTYTGMVISVPFLLVTFLVYLVLPESNLHRKALMSYVFALLVAYITNLLIIKMGQMPELSCHLLAYINIFFFLLSFFWMNVMCIDMWLAFSEMRTVISKRSTETRRFIFYCIYAWGVPVIHVGILLLLNHFVPIDSSFSPQLGVNRCFLGRGMPTFYYFYLPVAILIGINVVLFIMTAVRIQTIQKDTSMLKQRESKKSYEDDKQKFNLYLKLMFATGVNWIMEIVSWTVNQFVVKTPKSVWYFSDFTNAMYGVFIFFIFVFKKKIWQSLKQRYYIFIGKPHLANTLTTSSARGTKTSNYSTPDTAVSTDYRISNVKIDPEESALTRT